jgi:hypothetical protein
VTTLLTTAAGLLKEVYEGDVNEQLNNKAVTSKRIEKTSSDIFETPGGKYCVFPLHTKRNTGISYRGEYTRIAKPGRQGWQQAQETLRYGYGRILLTGQVVELADTNPQSFANVLDEEVSGLKTDLTVDRNRIMVGNPGGLAVGTGVTGILARSTAVSAGATLTVDSTHQLEAGMAVNVVDGIGGAVNGGNAVNLVIQSVASATSVVLSGSVAGTVVGSNIVRGDDANGNNFNQEPYGINSLIGNTGTVHGVNSATAGNEYWQSYVDSTTTTLSEEAMIAVCDNIEKRSGKLPTAIFTTHGVRRSYYTLMKQLRRYEKPKTWAGGLVGLSFMTGEDEIPLVVDKAIQAKTAFFLNEPDLKIYRKKDWYWDDKDGSMWKWVPDFDANQAMMKSYWQLVIHQRNSQGVMNNITES